MRLFIDTEFNEFKGPLISMALFPEDRNITPFYESLGCENPGSWVAEHVMPVIGKVSIPLDAFQRKLGYFLNQWGEVTIIADWHEDIAHFCNSLTTGPGMRIQTPDLRFEIQRNLDTVPPLIPHNALSDAEAMLRSAEVNVSR
jgi:hypothetical protein